MIIEGRGFGESFRALIAAKLARLDVAGQVTAFGANRIALGVAGRPELIDMLAVSCLLGPADAVVADVRVEDRLAP